MQRHNRIDSRPRYGKASFERPFAFIYFAKDGSSVTIEKKYVNMADVNSGPAAEKNERDGARIDRPKGSTAGSAVIRPTRSGERSGAGPINDGQPSAPPKSDADLFRLVELLYFAYRDFISDPDEILSEYGFGRAHHRVLHFVNRNPGLRVADLLDILKITKQSLGRVLKQLVDEGFIVQREGPSDRRQRLLYATDRGSALALRLASPQFARFEAAIAETSEADAAAAQRFLMAMVNPRDRGRVAELLNGRMADGQEGP